MSDRTCDAGDVGCGEGLAAWFRQQVRDTPPGHTVRCLVRDPAAREELPALTRLMGHTFESMEADPGGGFVITVHTKP